VREEIAMTGRRFRWLNFVLFGTAGAGLLALTSALNPAFAYGDDVTLIMGGTEDPLPNAAYLTDVNNDYILPNISPAHDVPTGLFTPEQGFPFPGFSQLTFGQSIVQGLGDLQSAIAAEPAGTHTVVFGFSQSATIATDYLDEIANGTVKNPPSPADLRFVLVGDPNNPDGGLFERFDGFYLPGFNEPFNGATPDLAYPTDIYTIQYDGFADFPRYPLDFLADANAVAGIYYDHLSPDPAYETLTPAQVGTAVVEPVSPGAAGDTTYYMIPTQTLPLLEPLVQAGAPQWLINLVNPDLRVLVDMGYGNIGGPDTEYANIPTPAQLLEVVNPLTVGVDLIDGAVQGVEADLVLAGALPQSDMPDAYPFVPSLDPGLTISLGQPSETLLSALAGAVGSGLYALNIPDFANGTSDVGDFITNPMTAGLGLDLGSLLNISGLSLDVMNLLG
jgi:PE-PPE domain-containing protein